MEDLSQRKPPQLNIKAEDTTPQGENGALVWSTSEGRLITYNEDAERWGVVGVYPALSSVRIPSRVYHSFVELTGISTGMFGGNGQFFVPFYLTENRSITAMGYEVTTAASSGSAAVGIYNTQVVNGISMPYELLTSATSMIITTTGIKTAYVSLSITMRAGIMYWASILVTAGVTLRTCVPPTRMTFGGSPINPLVLLRLSNSSGSLTNPAPSSPSSYTAIATTPILIYV